jgi:hypothetical protein
MSSRLRYGVSHLISNDTAGPGTRRGLRRVGAGRAPVQLEGHVRHGLNKIGIRRAFPVPLPLNAKRIIQVIADGHLQVRQRHLALERVNGRNSDMVELHQLTIWRPANAGTHGRFR